MRSAMLWHSAAPGNAGTRIGSSFLGHWFIMSGDDIVDFSVGDWKALTAPGMLQDAELAGVTPLGSILWTGARPAGTSSAGLRMPQSSPKTPSRSRPTTREGYIKSPS